MMSIEDVFLYVVFLSLGCFLLAAGALISELVLKILERLNDERQKEDL